MDLKQAWAEWVEAADYEQHMAAVGQAQANAALVAELFSELRLEPASAVLLAGAGSGQMFDYVPPRLFEPYRLTCSDISPKLLARLRERVTCEVVLDDVEETRLAPGFTALVLVLVLEHVDWRRALASLARLGAREWIIVIQRNPPASARAVTPGRIPPGTMGVFAAEAQPRLLDPGELASEMQNLGLALRAERSRSVADGKHMLGLHFTRS